MKRKQAAERWLKKAAEDEQFATSLLKHRDAPAYGVGFFSQQIAEKCLKGFLTANDTKPPRIHDIGKLIKQSAEINQDFLQHLPEAAKLTPYYLETRYPGDAPDINWSEAGELLKAAQNIKATVLKKLEIL